MSGKTWGVVVAWTIALGAPTSAPAQEVPSGTVIVGGMNDDSVWFVDLPTGERRGIIATHIAPHEVVLTSDGQRGVVTNYGDRRGPGNLIQVIDVASASVVRELVVDGYERIHGAVFLAGDSLLAVTSERTGEILVLGLEDGGIRRKLPTGGEAPHMVARGGRWLYTAVVVSDPEAEALVLVDRAEGRVRARMDVGAAAREAGLGDEPSPQGFTLSPDGAWAFVATKGIDRVAVVDLSGARVVRFLPSGAGPDGIAFSRVRISPGP